MCIRDRPKPFAHQRHVEDERVAAAWQRARKEAPMRVTPISQGAVALALFPGKLRVYLIARAAEDLSGFEDTPGGAPRVAHDGVRTGRRPRRGGTP